jgi:hypothetical protein
VRLNDAVRPRVMQEFDVGARPEGLAASSRAIWVANSGDGNLSQIIEATDEVRSIPNVGGEPVDLAIGAGAVWVADASGSTVARVDGGAAAPQRPRASCAQPAFSSEAEGCSTGRAAGTPSRSNCVSVTLRSWPLTPVNVPPTEPATCAPLV